jgi:hypothetical protein
MFVEEEVVA